MNEPHASCDATAKAASEPATYRLVIRAAIIPEDTHETVRPHSHRRTLALVAAGIAGLLALSWAGFNAFKIDSASSAADVEARNIEAPAPPRASAPREPASVVRAQSPLPATATAASGVAPTEAGATAATPDRSPPPSEPAPIHEVIPDVPRSALQTIRGTVRVSVRVAIDEHGKVIAAAAQDPGPSRYFERLALEASRSWTFTPGQTDEPRTVLLRFSFTREAASARATPL